MLPAQGLTRRIGGAAMLALVKPIAENAIPASPKRRCRLARISRTHLDCMIPPAMWLSGLKIAGTTAIAARQTTDLHGPQGSVECGFCVAELSTVNQGICAPHHASDTILMCDLSPTVSGSCASCRSVRAVPWHKQNWIRIQVPA